MKRQLVSFRRIVLLCVLVGLTGCQPLSLLQTPMNRPLEDVSFLTPRKSFAPDTVTLEVFIVRSPYGNEDLNQNLWKEVDEQVLSPELRSNLAANGLRMGIIGNQIPVTLARLMKLRDDENPTNNGIMTIKLEDMAQTPTLMRKTISARNHQRNEILTSEIIPYATVLFNEDGIPGGETFANAQGVLAVKTRTCGNGSVHVEIIPELQYGQARQQFSYDSGGAVTMAQARPKKSFGSLRSEFTITPGQFIVLANLKDKQGNLGEFMLTDNESDVRYQKLLCMRVCFTQHDEMFQADGVLPMDPSEVDTKIEVAGN
ncbi:MAG: hypothetical protein Q4D98_12175 [Planctomycetia bacterium]|nr:hypothetical protein [Planctomycetia bacterium]